MILIALLDGCLTSWRQMGRTVLILYINQMIVRALLLDRCLTGSTTGIGYFLRDEVRPYVPDAWIDSETLDEIDAELAGVEQQILGLLREVTE